MQYIIYSQKKDFIQIKTTYEKYVITHLDLKNSKPIQLFGGKNNV